MENNYTSDSKVLINNLCNYEIGYHSDVLNKDISIPAFAKNYETTIGDISEQVEKNNVAYTGVDGVGSHAVFLIVDDGAREFIFGTSEKPVQFTREVVAEMLAHQEKEDFKKALEDVIVTKNEALLMLNGMKHLYKELEEFGWKTKMLKDHCEWIVVKNVLNQ